MSIELNRYSLKHFNNWLLSELSSLDTVYKANTLELTSLENWTKKFQHIDFTHNMIEKFMKEKKGKNDNKN